MEHLAVALLVISIIAGYCGYFCMGIYQRPVARFVCVFFLLLTAITLIGNFL